MKSDELLNGFDFQLLFWTEFTGLIGFFSPAASFNIEYFKSFGLNEPSNSKNIAQSVCKTALRKGTNHDL